MTIFDPEERRKSFAELVALAPKHNSESCGRPGCRRCAGPHVASVPKAGTNPHRVAKQRRRDPNPFDVLVAPLRSHAPSMPDHLTKLMLTLAAAITDHGDDRWTRLLAWEKRELSVSLTREEPDEDTDEDGQARRKVVSSATEEERSDDRRAGRYAEDARHTSTRLLTTLTSRPTAHAVQTDVVRLRFLLAIAESRVPRSLKSREMQASQAAADGWCRSCIRVGIFEPIGVRATGEPFYRDLCRWCGSNKGDLEQPPAHMLRVHHRLPERKVS